MTSAQQEKYLKQILERLDELQANQEEIREKQKQIHRAVFGDDATRSKSLREEMLVIGGQVEELLTWLDRIKWIAATLGTTNVGALILGWIGIQR